MDLVFHGTEVKDSKYGTATDMITLYDRYDYEQ